MTIGNALFSNMGNHALVMNAYYTYNGNEISVANVTFDRIGILCLGYGADYYRNRLFAYNCIFANVTNLTIFDGESVGAYTWGSHNGFYNSPTFGQNQFTNTFWPFHAVGAGRYYLTNGCNFRNVGTTNLNPTLLAALRKKTTYPPIVYSNLTITTDTVFSPQAQRDTDIPDLGHHYDPLDYLVNNVYLVGGVSLKLEEGVAVASYGTRGFFTYEDAARLIAHGKPLSRNQLCVYSAVQEQPVRLGGVRATGIVDWNGWDRPAVLDARFTDFNGMAGL